MKKILKITGMLTVAALLLSFVVQQGQRPVLYIIGDSTVRNGDGSGKNGQWGWGSLLHPYADTTRLRIENHAIGGRSSRTFLTEGRWEKIVNNLQQRDVVLIQFGHNDAGPLDDTARARGSLRGIGPESKTIYNPIRRVEETVYTYGAYLRRYVQDAKARGAIPVLCTPVPRNNWQEGRIRRGNADYALWARQVAEAEQTLLIDLNELVALQYEAMDTAAVNQLFFGDHTHTSHAGATLNAATVARALAAMPQLPIRPFFKQL